LYASARAPHPARKVTEVGDQVVADSLAGIAAPPAIALHGTEQ
jgi:hypothetical protein